jgi:hypothetical protein
MILYLYRVDASRLFFDARLVSTHRTEESARAAFRKLAGVDWDAACYHGTPTPYRVGNGDAWEVYTDSRGDKMLRLRSRVS